MLEHLSTLKCTHWDERVRELAATALERLAPFDEQFALETVSDGSGTMSAIAVWRAQTFFSAFARFVRSS